MVYTDTPPEGVSEAVRSALSALDVQWSEHPVHGGFPGCLVSNEHWVAGFAGLKGKAGFELLVDHTAIDYPARAPGRFTVVGLLMNIETQERLMVRTRVADGASVPTLSHLWKSADWAERETYDMFGIRFEGHPDLRRILMPEEYTDFPLRKEFPLFRG